MNIHMKTTLARWGNSIAVRIPKPFAAEAHLKAGITVDLSLKNESLIVSKSKPDLKKLLQKIKPSQLHGETDTGAVIGREQW